MNLGAPADGVVADEAGKCSGLVAYSPVFVLMFVLGTVLGVAVTRKS